MLSMDNMDNEQSQRRVADVRSVDWVLLPLLVPRC